MEKLSLRDFYGKKLVELGEENKKIVALDADLSGSTKTSFFAEKFPERFFDMGIAESDMIGTAVGLSLLGFIPFVSTFAVFGTGRCYDQIRQSVCISKTNVKIVVTHGGITVGEDGATHQMVEDIALMTSLPNMKVYVPADAYQTRALIEYVAKVDGPCFVRLSREKFPIVYEENKKFDFSKADVLRNGEDLTFVATGLMVHNCLKAAEILEEMGVNAEVINVCSIKPIDKETLIKSARKTNLLITVEEHSVINGLGAQVLSAISEDSPVPLKKIGIEDRFGISGKPDELLEYFGLDSKSIAQKAIVFFEKKGDKLKKGR